MKQVAGRIRAEAGDHLLADDMVSGTKPRKRGPSERIRKVRGGWLSL